MILSIQKKKMSSKTSTKIQILYFDRHIKLISSQIINKHHFHSQYFLSQNTISQR